jgi:hypothetical protein
MDGLSVMTTILKRCLGRAGVSGKRIEWRPVLQKLERDCGGVAKTVEGTASNRQISIPTDAGCRCRRGHPEKPLMFGRF